MNRGLHVSEPKWGDEPDFDEEYFEERRAYDLSTLFAVGCGLVVVLVVLAIWWWLVSTMTPGRDYGAQGFIEEARR